MKKIFIFIAAIIFFTACKKGSFLDDKSNNALNEQSVFTDSVNTMSFLTRIYEDMPAPFYKQRLSGFNASTEQATDDSECDVSNPLRKPVVLYSSTVSPDNFPFLDNFWQLPWNNIRRANLLLSKLPTVPLNPKTKTRIEAETRFLRAWFYQNLLINFGGMPIIKDQVFTITDVVNFPRNTFAENIDYIIKEYDAAAAVLPDSYQGNDYGRVTKGAALALKSRLLLYAASPLFNGGSFPAPSSPERIALVSYPTYNVARWQAAAEAANAVIQSGMYSLNVDNTTASGYGFYSVFLKRINSEYIFYYNRANNKDFETFYLPASRGGNGKIGAPTQNLVESFPMKNGKAISDPTSGYDPTNPYVNRDPRFAYSIIYNGANYFSTSTNTKIPVYTYVGAATDGFPNPLTVTGVTGYFSRKMCDENLAANSPGNTERGYPILRYAEILLNYAEAINETGQTSLAYPVLRELRQRAGINPGTDNMYGMKANMTVSEMRAFLQNERRVELMYEDHRWDDVRRWKIAMTTQNGYNKLMKITRNVNGTYAYQVVNSIALHAFYERNYLLPIPTSEILKAPAMLQNPGW